MDKNAYEIHKSEPHKIPTIRQLAIDKISIFSCKSSLFMAFKSVFGLYDMFEKEEIRPSGFLGFESVKMA